MGHEGPGKVGELVFEVGVEVVEDLAVFVEGDKVF